MDAMNSQRDITPHLSHCFHAELRPLTGFDATESNLSHEANNIYFFTNEED